VDALLDDPAFFGPFAPYFHPVLGRPSTPVECYLRLMFLKFRYRLGYESLCAEVSDSISWRRFCQIGLDGKVPHPTTLMKLTTRCGDGAVAGLNEALLAKAAGAKLLRTARVRADTTVISANVAYPTDAGLLAKAVGKLVRAARRMRAAGGAAGTVMTDRRRAAARRMREIAASPSRRKDHRRWRDGGGSSRPTSTPSTALSAASARLRSPRASPGHREGPHRRRTNAPRPARSPGRCTTTGPFRCPATIFRFPDLNPPSPACIRLRRSTSPRPGARAWTPCRPAPTTPHSDSPQTIQSGRHARSTRRASNGKPGLSQELNGGLRFRTKPKWSCRSGCVPGRPALLLYPLPEAYSRAFRARIPRT
jgi:IS5 family transposase